MTPPFPGPRRRMLHWVIYPLLILGGLWLFFRWFEQSNVYHPTRTWWATGAELQRPWEDLRCTTRDGVELSAWFFPAHAHDPFRDVAILLSHGNGGNLSHRLSLLRLLTGAGFNVLAYDYRGYGKSQGRPSEVGTYEDAEAALSWLKNKGFPENRILAWGESLGGGIASELAARHPGLGGLVLQSTFTSLTDLGSELFPFLPVRTLARYHYNTIQKLPRIACPVLILHSRTDSLIPFQHAEKNFAAASEPKLLREVSGDHNDQPDVEPERFKEALVEFTQKLPKRVP